MQIITIMRGFFHHLVIRALVDQEVVIENLRTLAQLRINRLIQINWPLVEVFLCLYQINTPADSSACLVCNAFKHNIVHLSFLREILLTWEDVVGSQRQNEHVFTQPYRNFPSYDLG